MCYCWKQCNTRLSKPTFNFLEKSPVEELNRLFSRRRAEGLVPNSILGQGALPLLMGFAGRQQGSLFLS